MRPGHPWFTGNAFAMATVTVLGLSVLAACTSSSNSSGTTHRDEPAHGADHHRRVAVADRRLLG